MLSLVLAPGPFPAFTGGLQNLFIVPIKGNYEVRKSHKEILTDFQLPPLTSNTLFSTQLTSTLSFSIVILQICEHMSYCLWPHAYSCLSTLYMLWYPLICMVSVLQTHDIVHTYTLRHTQNDNSHSQITRKSLQTALQVIVLLSNCQQPVLQNSRTLL